MIAVEKNPKSFQYIGRNLKDDDDIFKLAFQQNEEILRHASDRLRKNNNILPKRVTFRLMVLSKFSEKLTTHSLLENELLD